MTVVEVATRDHVVEGRHGSVPVREYRASGPEEAATPLLWIHGGAFFGGGLDQRESDAVARAIAADGRPVVAVDYRLVPRPNFRGPLRIAPSVNRHPVAIDDCEDAFTWFEQRMGRPAAIGGASAGAFLATSVTQRRRADLDSSPTALVLVYGVFHAALPPLSDALRARVRGIHGVLQFRPDTVHRMNLNYAGSEEVLHDPATFPATGPLDRMPPTLMLDADRDTLRASGEAFRDALRAAGVPLTSSYLPGSTHGFLDRPQRPYFAEGIRTIREWLTRSVG